MQDLCLAALKFASDTLRAGGHFVCKYYQGDEDKKFESILKKMFTKVSREKPDASRSVCILPSCISAWAKLLYRNREKPTL